MALFLHLFLVIFDIVWMIRLQDITGDYMRRQNTFFYKTLLDEDFDANDIAINRVNSMESLDEIIKYGKRGIGLVRNIKYGH